MSTRIVRLANVAEINPGRPSLNFADNDIVTFVPMEAVDGTRGVIATAVERTFLAVKKGYTVFAENDVIFAKITPCMQNGKHALARNLRQGFGFGSTEFHVIRAGVEIAPEWIHFFLRRKETLDAAVQTFTGTVGQQRVPAGFLEELEIPLPPLDQQHRIAADLKAQLAVVEEARKAAQVQEREAELLARRIREDSLADLAGVKRVVLGNVLKGIETGRSFQTLERLAREDELGILKVSAVSWTNFQPHEAKAIATTHVPDERHRVKAGDLLMTRANTVELVGAVVRVGQDFPHRLLSDKTLRLLTNEALVCPSYLLQILRMPEARIHIEGNATGTSSSMRNISQDTIQATPIPLIPLEAQRRFAQRLCEADAAVREAKSATQAQLSEIERLPARLLAQAFGNV